MPRYITRMAVLETADGATEFWLGIIADADVDLSEWDDLIPADGMTADELSVVSRWLEL